VLVSRAIPALYGGVSQQPDTQRSPIQLAEMINSWSTVVDGIGKRPPSEHVAQLSEAQLESAFMHLINRDLVERYVVAITDGDIEVYDLDGTQRVVAFPYDKAYLDVPSGKTARETFACVTVADYTFILNKTKVVTQGVLDSDRTTSPLDYYNVNRPPNQTGAAQTQYPPNPTIGTYRGVVQTFQDLPSSGAVEGDTYKIQATADSGFNGYYVRRTSGTWIEVTRPGANNTIDEKTMPWALVRLGDGTFEFAPFSWAPRRVGDESSNPGPSFLGRTINDIYFAENRLAVTCDENTTLSRAGDFGNYWRMSAMDLFDDDVVDIAATETKVTKMRYAVPLAGHIMLFADQVQFRLDKGQFMTPTSCSLTVTTNYPTAPLVRPAPLGSDVYFGSEEGGWVRLFEYFVRDDSNNTDAADVTAHVPRYVPKGLRDITTSPEHDAVFLLTSGAKNRVYHYKFYWANENEKAQSAWGYWEFPADHSVIASECIGEYLYIVVVRPTGTFVERIDLSANATAPNTDFEVHLDRRAVVSGTYDAANAYTIFALPYAVPEADRADFKIVKGGLWSVGKGALLNPDLYTWVNDQTVMYPGNVSTQACLIGMSYTQRWTFSKWFMRNSNNDPDLSGRLQIRTVSLAYSRAGFFQTEVSPYGGDPEVEAIVPSMLSQFTGKTLGSAQLLVGDPVFDSGSYSFQVYGNAEDSVISITNDSHLGAWFVSAEVEFFWQKRARFA
jgi:hypothetical protein